MPKHKPKTSADATNVTKGPASPSKDVSEFTDRGKGMAAKFWRERRAAMQAYMKRKRR
jgi:hypothetical protein